jgi:mRNA interferase MazF
MRGGGIVTVAVSGDYGKPRPAVIIQANRLDDTDSVLVCRITTTERDTLTYRLRVRTADGTGLREISYVMADKVFAAKRAKCGRVIGRPPVNLLIALDRMLAIGIGFADWPFRTSSGVLPLPGPAGGFLPRIRQDVRGFEG